MIIAAIDNSGSTSNYLDFYREKVFQVLSNLKGPVRIILWSSYVESDITHDKIWNKQQIFGNYTPRCCTYPDKFFNVLPINDPIDLYVFTDGILTLSDIQKCHNILDRKYLKIQISHVNLYYIGIEKYMETQFTTVFRGIPQEIYIQDKRVAKVEAEPIDLGNVDYDYIMKDDSLKANILFLINSGNVNQTELKVKVSRVLNNILMKRFRDVQQLSIQTFYENKDVSGCVAYIKKHSFYKEKIYFQRKMSSILRLFDKNIDTYSLSVYRDVSPPPDSDDDEDEHDNDKTEPVVVEELQVEYLTCDILYDKCDVACIPVKVCGDGNFWPDKKSIRNPFRLLESEKWIEGILRQVEPFVLDFNKAYKHLQNPDVSPFSRDTLKGVYLLQHHHPSNLDPKALMRHNNYVLSTFFGNKLPGKPVLWHAVFLYLLATRKFPEHREVFFREIRYLGERDEKYFVSLTPYLNPPVVDTLNVCFWYLACVCSVAWPNSVKNVLRNSDYISGVFLDFYRDVYDPKYERPKEMSVWQLWYELCNDRTEKKTAIFRILSRYFRHDRLADSSHDFGIVLYREKQKKINESLLDLDTVLKVYNTYRRDSSPKPYQNLSDLPSAGIRLLDETEEKEDKLQHVSINLVTCHPYVNCSTSGKHWRECVGQYDPMKESYLRMFRRYCIKYEKYPESRSDLMVFLNEYIYDRTDRLPELFQSALPRQMDQVMQIFKEVMKKYTCNQYINVCKRTSSEKIRLQYE